MQAVQQALDPEQAQTFLAVQAERHRTNLDQLQVFKGRHLMAQECYRSLIERLHKAEVGGGKEGEACVAEKDGLAAACAMVGEAVQEAHGMMLQQAGSVRENEAMSILISRQLEVFAAAQEQQRQADAAKEDGPAQAQTQEPEQSREYTDTPGHVGVMCSEGSPDAEKADDPDDDGIVLLRDQPRVVPAHYEHVDSRDFGDFVGKTVGRALQEARPGRHDWTPPAWMSTRRTGAMKAVE